MSTQPSALVLGATGGIGAAVAEKLIAHGYFVFGTTHHNLVQAQGMEKTLGNCAIMPCDVTKAADIEQLFNRIQQQDAAISVYVNAISPPLQLKTFEQLTIEELALDLNTILLGSAHVLKNIVPRMKVRRTGTIIHLLTALIDQPATRLSSYLAAKSGLWGLCRALAVELEPFGVRVLGVSPSFVETELIHAFPPKLLELERQKLSGGTFLQPYDIAECIWDIIQNEKKYPSGSNVIIRNSNDLPHTLHHDYNQCLYI